MPPSSRRVAARVVAGLAAVFWGFLWFGVIDLLVVVEQDERFHQHYLLESGWGLLYLVVVAAPLVALAGRPGRADALAQLVVATVAVLVGALWGGAWPQLWTGLGLGLTVTASAWLGRGRPVRWTRPDALLSVLALVGLPVAVGYGAPLAREAIDVGDITNGVNHYPMQASLALAVVGLVALAAVTRSRLPAWSAGISALWLGIESVAYPDLPASLGTTGGVLTVAWGVLVVVAVELARRGTLGAARPSVPSSARSAR